MGKDAMPFSGARLQALRKKARLSQSDLAKKAGLSVRSLQSWEIDRRAPGFDALTALCRALGVSLDELAKTQKK
jgi:transcriptional regulator with XRE-family HTH domain